jgi:hypothetical protein
MERNLALEYRVRKQREDQSKEIIRELEERAAHHHRISTAEPD